jgi:hypothetical protein
MLSFNAQYIMTQRMAQDYDTNVVLPFFKQQLNLGLHVFQSEVGTFYTEETRTGSTSSSTNTINLPENCVRIKAFYVTSGTQQYYAEEIFDEDTWRRIQSTTQGVTSNFVRYMFRRATTLEIYPTPSSTCTYTLIYEAGGKELSADDYSTGTITTLAALGTAVTANATSFTSSMIGRFLKTDDGAWYKISAVGSTTTLTLNTAYQGVAIAAGTSSYTIGEMPNTPPPTHHIPVYFALWQYYSGMKRDAKFATLYKNQYEQYMQWAKATYGKRYSSSYIPSQRRLNRDYMLNNPNYSPTTIT